MTAFHLAQPHLEALFYQVRLHADPAQSLFFGTVRIFLQLHQPTAAFYLDAKDLQLQLQAASVTQGQALALSLHPQAEQVRVQAPTGHTLLGKLTLVLQFSGQLSQNLQGLYVTGDARHRCIASQCQPDFARYIFPCLDAPRYKARIQWEIVTRPELTVITNGQWLKTTQSPHRHQVVQHFAPTPPISSYLFAVCIGPFKSSALDNIGKNNTPSCIVSWMPVSQSRWARQITKAILPRYEHYFNTAYPYAKLDQVALPGFDAGAMENAGAIFYREQMLLYARGHSRFEQKKRIAEVVAHELAHQWFGNLVTLAWWDDLWLNEAFATFMAYKFIHAWQKSWQLWDDFYLGKEAALYQDGFASTHAIYTPVQNSQQSAILFDAITYEKGCAVLWMLHAYMGHRLFRTALRRYIHTHRWGCTTRFDLWKSFSNSSPHPQHAASIQTMLEGWIIQKGFPLLTFTLERPSHVLMTQQSFYVRTQTPPGVGQTCWQIPLSLVWQNQQGQWRCRKLLLKQQQQRFSLPKDVRFFHANPLGLGFFRCHYQGRLRTTWLQQDFHVWPHRGVAVWLDDALALWQHGQPQAFKTLLHLLHKTRSVGNFFVQTRRLHILYHLKELLASPHSQRAFARFFALQMANITKTVRLTPSQGDEKTKHFRAKLLLAWAELGLLPQALWQACETWQWREQLQTHTLDAEFCSSVVKVTALRGDVHKCQTYLQTIAARRQAGQSAECWGRYVHALPYFRQPAAIDLILQSLFTPVIPQDQRRWLLVPLLTHTNSQMQTFAFVADPKHYLPLKNDLGATGMHRLIESLGQMPYASLAKVQRLARAWQLTDQRCLAEAQERIQLRYWLRQTYQRRFNTWLQQRFGQSVKSAVTQ